MELGEDSRQEHTSLVQLINKYAWRQVVLVGGDFKHVHAPYLYFDTSAEAGQWLKQQGFENTYLLVKGSRSMQMEKVLEA